MTRRNSRMGRNIFRVGFALALYTRNPGHGMYAVAHSDLPGVGADFLQRLRRERIAVARITLFHAALEPAHALLRRAVRERIGRRIALRLLLEAVVADRGGCGERLVHVARIEEALVLHVVPPDARVAVGLQLHANRGAGGAFRGTLPLHAIEDPAQLLDVMPDFM